MGLDDWDREFLCLEVELETLLRIILSEIISTSPD